MTTKAGGELSVPSVPRSVAHVRRFARLAAADVPSCLDVVELLVSEVATNAMIHGAGEVRVRVTVTGEVVRVEVDDDDPGIPVVRPPSPTAEGGRGLALVTALSRDWGTLPRDGGKTVWFEVSPA